jgi:hypothetical protein
MRRSFQSYDLGHDLIGCKCRMCLALVAFCAMLVASLAEGALEGELPVLLFLAGSTALAICSIRRCAHRR